MKEISVEEQLTIAAEHIRDIYLHARVQTHLILIEGYHQIGQIILSLPSRYEAVADLRRLTGVSESTLYRAAQFYEAYPDYSALPDGNALTWNKIVTKYLPKNESEPDHIHDFELWLICSCGERKHAETA